jgi:glycyl-tRNA synthetase beta subunit
MASNQKFIMTKQNKSTQSSMKFITIKKNNVTAESIARGVRYVILPRMLFPHDVSTIDSQILPLSSAWTW